MQIVIDIPEEVYEAYKRNPTLCTLNADKENIAKSYLVNGLINGTPLPKGHGKLVDISKIDEDRIDSNNPVISLTIGGEYIEAVSLDYLNDLETIVEEDAESGVSE